MRCRHCLVFVPLVAAACASAPRPAIERGWVGGEFRDVSRTFSFDEHVLRAMPDSAPGDSAALLTSAPANSPLVRAGLAPGDLVLSIGGGPATSALDLRERVESLAPGAHTEATFWRAGAVHTADVVVGRETYESVGTIQIGLPLSLRVDLWPFDDGITIFDLVRVRWDRERHDLGAPVNSYLREVGSGEDAAGPRQESWEVFVLPIGGGKGKRVIRQETLP